MGIRINNMVTPDIPDQTIICLFGQLYDLMAFSLVIDTATTGTTLTTTTTNNNNEQQQQHLGYLFFGFGEFINDVSSRLWECLPFDDDDFILDCRRWSADKVAIMNTSRARKRHIRRPRHAHVLRRSRLT